MDNKNLHSTVASLESKLDLAETELSYLDEMLTRLGFSEGIKTLKSTVEEILEEEGESNPSRKDNFF